jgi:DNA-binding NarL/FixJ family response regulator
MSTLLLIEDHAPLRRNLEEILTLEGHRVLAAGDGPTGLRLAHEQRPDLVLCDIMLPGMDGLEILARLRADAATRGMPFIFLTAKGEPRDIRAGMNLGADDYLPKPVILVDLLASIRARLDRAANVRSHLPDFSRAAPLEKLGITPREAEVLLWMAQGKANADIAIILGCTHATVKKHSIHLFEKLGVESRGAAMLIAIEALSSS